MTKEKVLKLDSKIFEGPINNEVNSLYVRVYLANQRQGNAKTKTRGEVSGGGVKPFRQKGTGKARAGSRRSSLHVHGGTSHGPVPKDYRIGLTEKVRRVALKSTLSLKAKDDSVKIIDDVMLSGRKTKEIWQLLKNSDVLGNILLVTEKHNNNVFTSGRNIKDLTIKSATDVNPYDILKARSILIESSAIKVLEKRV